MSVRRGIQALVDVLFPDVCQACGSSASGATRPIPGRFRPLLAAASIRRLGGFPIQSHPLCCACLHGLSERSPDTIAGARKGSELVVIAPFTTTATILSLIHQIKFSGYSSLLTWLACPVAAAVGTSQSDPTWSDAPTLMVPVPMDSRSRRLRGFNQAEVLARAVSSLTRIPVGYASLRKVRRTRPQSLTPAEDRDDNIHGAFSWKGSRLSGFHVILVDDLVTTGATARECTRILGDSGAESVSILSIAAAREVP